MTSVFDRPYWDHTAAGELRLQRCVNCGQFRYPPGPTCPECLADAHTWEPLSGNGFLLAWTTFHRQYLPDFPAPYTVVAVRTPEGPVLIGDLAGEDPGQLRHDMPMRAVLHDRWQWRPIHEEQQ